MSRQVDELERRLRPGAPRSSDDEVERLAAVAEDLRAASPLALVPRQAFRDGLRSRLLAEATELGPARAAAARAERETVVAGAAAAEHRPQVQVTPKDGPGGAILSGRRLAPFWRLKRLVAGLSIAALLGTGAAAVASTGALPGDALYGLKRAVEDVRLQLAGSDASKGATALDHARERLEEAEDLALSAPGGAADADSPQLRQTLADFSSSSEDGIRLLLQGYADDGDPAALVQVDAFVQESLPLLERLREETPSSLHPVIDALHDDLRGTQDELTTTVAACGEPCRGLGLLAGTESGPGASPGGPTQPVRSGGSADSPVAPSTGAPGVPGVPDVTVPGVVVVEPADPGGGLLPGDLPAPSASAPVSLPPAPLPAAPSPVAPGVPGVSVVPVPTGTGVVSGIGSPNPVPAPPPVVPCVLDPVLGSCPG